MNKIITSTQEFPCLGRYSENRDGREWCRIIVEGDYADIKQAFDGTPFRHEWDSTQDGQPIVESKDFPDFPLLGDIVDKRDGTFVVYMGKKTDLEQAVEAKAELTAEVKRLYDGGKVTAEDKAAAVEKGWIEKIETAQKSE